MSGFLKGLRLLLVRPELAGNGLDQTLKRAGAVVYHLPVMKIVPFPDGDGGAAVERQMRNFGRYQKAIFISANAARLCLDWLDRCGLTPPAETECYAVGDSTAAVLRERGVEVGVPPSEMTSEGLLKLPGLAEIAGQNVLLLKGVGGRDILATELRRRGAKVDSCELYCRERTLEHRDEIRRLVGSGQVDVIMVHSGELLSNLSEILKGLRWDLPMVVPSRRIERAAEETGHRQCILAQNATPRSMVSALQEWYINSRIQ